MIDENILSVSYANPADLDGIFKYAVQIVRQHQNFNPARFSTLENHFEELYEFFRAELSNPQTIISALRKENSIVGYALVKMEDDSLIDLISARAWLHDIYIDEAERGSGGGKMLLDAAKEAAQTLGSKSLMLHVAAQNSFGQKFFKDNGFEITVFEMMFDSVKKDT
jgi:ribosomal protein S18 acetylase RimI-like enzyme